MLVSVSCFNGAVSKRSSAGGAGAARGVGHEPRIFAWFSAHVLARQPLPEWLVPNMQVYAVGLQTAYDMDDGGVRITPSDGLGEEGRVFLQSKGGLKLSNETDSDLGAAIDQAIAQWFAGIGGRPLDRERDRLVIVTDATASENVRRDLARVVNDRLATAPDEIVSRNEGEEKAAHVLRVHIERAWQARRGCVPSAGELADFYAALRLLVLDLDDGRPDRIVAEALLRPLLADPKQAANAWEVLTTVGKEHNEKQQWVRRNDLIQALRHRRHTLSASAQDRIDKAIEGLLAAQIAAADAFSYPGTLRPVSAVDVYVRQTVVAGPATSPETFAPQPFHQVLARSNSRPLLVFGEAGLGKSTLTRQEAARLAKEAERTRFMLPLWVSALDLASAEGSLSKAILSCATKALGLHLEHEVPEDLLTATANEHWLLLVDGLDEISDPARQHALLQVLAAHARRADGMRMVITSRPLTDQRLKELRRAGFDTYALQHLDHGQLTEFARKWFDGDDATADRFLAQAVRPELRDLLRVPLVATLAAMLHEADPERALPAQRFTLYERYLGVLSTGRDNDLLPDTVSPRCAPALRDLRERIWEVVEHLASTQVDDAPRDLLPYALTWVRTNIAGNVVLHDPLWEERVTNVLTGTGLFDRTGSGLRFIHMSFAEHLAARFCAGKLPDRLDLQDPVWQSALRRALRSQTRHIPEGDPNSSLVSPSWHEDIVARDTLVHYTYLHPQSAAGLVRHLQTRGENGRLLAGHLLGEVSTAEQGAGPLVAAFLGHLQIAVHRIDDRLSDWFHVAGRIRSPLITDYLLAMAMDHDRWAYERVRAARALAGSRPREAVIALRTLADSLTTDPNMLDEIARTLLDVDRAQSEAVIGALRRLLHHPAASPESICQAAETLASLGGVHVDEAAGVLYMAAVDLNAAPSDRLDAARLLGDLEAPDCEARCVRALWAIVDSPEGNLFERAEALGALRFLDHEGVDEVADKMLAFLMHEATKPRHVWGAVELINASAPMRNDDLRHALQSLIENLDTPEETRMSAEGELRKLMPRESTIPQMPRSKPPPEDPAALTDRMCRALGNLEEDFYGLQYAALELAELGPVEAEQGAVVLRERIAATDTLASLIETADVLSELGPTYVPEAAEIVRSLTTAADTRPKDRVRAARLLLRFGPAYAAEAYAIFRAIVHDFSADMATCDAAIKAMGEFRPEYAPKVAEYLRGMIASGEVDPPSRRRLCAEALGFLGPMWTEEAALTLRPLMDDEDIPCVERINCAASLANLRGCYEVEGIAWLRRFMTDSNQPADARYDASQALTDITEKYSYQQDLVMQETQPEFHALLAACID
ncbi:NACHT domain-containing protein [Streptomyces sp. NPDC002215]|uniref:NACHT domain-containing protein n=1 Tax=Streptomyces sp. NPDC002215 TaxID=3154412 RepID=UPI00332DB27C